MPRDGIVYIAEDVARTADAPRFIGHWEALDPPGLRENGPGWSTAEEAIAWGRTRADIVLVRLGMPGTYYSAGVAPPPNGQLLPPWPPG